MEVDNLKQVFWIDKNINSKQNQYTYQEFIYNLPGHNIIRVESVKEAFDIIIDPKNYEKYKFKLFYVIVSGKLAEEFFNEYIKKSFEYHILAATVIYCSEKDQKSNEYKPFFLDTYLNPGKVTSSSYFVIQYIKLIQYPYYLEEPTINKNEIKNANNMDPEFAAEFTQIDSLGEISYPILISKHINSTLIDKDELENMQKEFMNLYPKFKHLFRPSQEKNIFIPYHILAKFYLYIYTSNSNFFCDMNNDLKNRKFDNYRIYIYLMYNALNKGIFKSYCKSHLYRGGTLSFEEFNSLMEKFNRKKNLNLTGQKIFFFSRKFLSFSKDLVTANYFLQTAIACEYTGVYVRFIVEGIEDNDYYVTNIDINEMKLSEFNREEEVLFLPLSCFEVVDVQSEIYCQSEIKVVRLRYLNKYKKEIDKRCEELSKNQNSEELKGFILNSINSLYAEELTRYLGNQDALHKKFLNEFERRSNIDLKFEAGARFQYKNSNPMGKNYSPEKIFPGSTDKLLSEIINEHINWLSTKLSSIQFGIYNEKPCLCGYDDGDKMVFYDDFNCLGASCPKDRLKFPIFKIEPNRFIPKSKKICVKNLNCGDIRKTVYKHKNKIRMLKNEGINKIELVKTIKIKDYKKLYKQSGAIEWAMLGNAVGHFIANYDEFKDANLENKAKMIGNSSIPLGFLLLKKMINITPVVKETFAGTLFKKGFFVLSLFDLCRSFSDIIFSESLKTKEKFEICGKKALGYGVDMLFGYLGAEIGMQIALALGITFLPGMAITAAITGGIVGYIGAKISNKINGKEKKLIFYSDSLYYQYIPKKFREFAIPILKMENIPIKAKSLAIELIVNEDGKNPSWLIINIPPNIREFNENTKAGDTIINYKGVPENAFCSCFILYVFDIKYINIKEFLDMKNGLIEGENLSKHLIDYKILAVS